MAWRGAIDTGQTLFGLATGSLPSAIAIVRLSGPAAHAIARSCFRPRSGEPLARDRGLSFGDLVEGGERFDEALAVVFPAASSPTGEDVVEFHCHGSEAVVRRLERILAERGARPAVRGEFSYRAFLNGKQSARGLETLADLFSTRQPADLSALFARRDGSLERLLSRVRESLIGVQAALDTAIDFSEEYSEAILQAKTPLVAAIHECSAAIQRYETFARGRDIARLILAGAPNAGKSSLFNALLGRRRALVYAEPGTTRDAIEEEIELGGRVVRLVDTAGVREATGEGPETEGIALTRTYLESGCRWLLVVDGTRGLSESDAGLLERYRPTLLQVVWNKRDVPGWSPAPAGLPALALSTVTGDGVSQLAEALRNSWGEGVPDAPLPTAGEAARLRALREALQHLLLSLDAGAAPEVLAEENRSAIRLAEAVVGEIDTEAVLDRVFREFCIGK